MPKKIKKSLTWFMNLIFTVLDVQVEYYIKEKSIAHVTACKATTIPTMENKLYNFVLNCLRNIYIQLVYIVWQFT